MGKTHDCKKEYLLLSKLRTPVGFVRNFGDLWGGLRKAAGCLYGLKEFVD